MDVKLGVHGQRVFENRGDIWGYEQGGKQETGENYSVNGDLICTFR